MAVNNDPVVRNRCGTVIPATNGIARDVIAVSCRIKTTCSGSVNVAVTWNRTVGMSAHEMIAVPTTQAMLQNIGYLDLQEPLHWLFSKCFLMFYYVAI